MGFVVQVVGFGHIWKCLFTFLWLRILYISSLLTCIYIHTYSKIYVHNTYPHAYQHTCFHTYVHTHMYIYVNTYIVTTLNLISIKTRHLTLSWYVKFMFLSLFVQIALIWFCVLSCHPFFCNSCFIPLTDVERHQISTVSTDFSVVCASIIYLEQKAHRLYFNNSGFSY